MTPAKRVYTRLSLWLRHIARDKAYLRSARQKPAQRSKDIIVILDGTLASLKPEKESNAGILFQLLNRSSDPADRRIYYEPGLQWSGWHSAIDLMIGRGINRQIMGAYGWLASQYQPGDRIFFFGYSRGAYAVRSLAGMIDRLGLVKSSYAAERYITQAYCYYQNNVTDSTAQEFSREHCHPHMRIEMVGVWDTVKALGWPVVGRFMPNESGHRFHNHELGASIAHGYQALALDETRVAFAPVLWTCPKDWPGHVEQCWFRGAHSDIGGHIGGKHISRPLANIPLVWMLERAEASGLTFPDGWRDQFPCDATAPMVGTFCGAGTLLLLRKRRKWGRQECEKLHESVKNYRKIKDEPAKA